jgi:hypothetical protein
LTEPQTAGQSRVVMASVHATVAHVANSQGDRGALVEDRQEAAVDNHRRCDSERVRAHPNERRFPAKPDRRVDPDSAVEIRSGALDE